MSRVDVVIPCYKYAHYLRGCVEAVLSQPVDVRVLIIDDCSPDNTSEVAAQLAADDKRVEFRRHAVNRGHIASYNEGLLGWARSEYSVLISADDLLTPGSLMRAARLMDEHPEVGFVYGRAVKFYTGDDLPQPVALPDYGLKIHKGRSWIGMICEEAGNVIYSPEVLVRTSLQQRLGGYRADLPHSGDLEMWLRFAAHADVAEIDADQAYYRLHAANMHHQHVGHSLRDWRQRKAAFDTLFSEYGSRVEGVADLRQHSMRRLAERAAWEARLALTNHAPDHCRELIAFAVETYPQSRFWPGRLKTSLMVNANPGIWLSKLKASRRPTTVSDTA